MPLQTDELLDRFHRVMVDEIRTSRPELLASRFTVAEIYQELVPYSTHRDQLGVAMNGDYEHLLLMLLAGEGDYLRLESEAALVELRAELRSPNPNTGLYREYAAADVRLNPDRLDPRGESRAPLQAVSDDENDRAISRPVPPEMADQLVPVEFLAPRGGRNVAEEPDHAPPGGETSAPTSPGSGGPGSQPSGGTRSAEAGEPVAPVQALRSCRSCESDLPARDGVVFCPFCGVDLRALRCTTCDTSLEPEWRFCITCGTEVVGG